MNPVRTVVAATILMSSSILPVVAGTRSSDVVAVSLLGRSPSTENAGHQRLEREHAFIVELPLADAFVLFTPVGEKNWAEGWRPIFASPEDAELREGSVFSITSVTPAGGEVHSVWVVSRYAPPASIEYRNVISGVRATHITVRCEAIEDSASGGAVAPLVSSSSSSSTPAARSRTRVTVRYVYSGLSEAGDAFIAQMTEGKFRAMIESWSTMIAAYLVRGTPATP